MYITEEHQNRVKQIDRGLYLKEHSAEYGSYIQVWHKDDRNGSDVKVFTLMDENGRPKDLDMQVLNRLRHSVDWSLVGKYPDPKERSTAILKAYNDARRKLELERKGFLFDFNRDHKKEWRQVMENTKNSMTREQYKALVLRDEIRKETLKKQGKFKDYYIIGGN